MGPRVRIWLGVCLALSPLAARGATEAEPKAERLVWPGAISALEARLASEDVQVRRRAAADLGRLPAVVQRRVLPRLFSDPDPDVRLAVADAALSIRLPDAGARVAKWLSDPDPRVREAAAEVLGVLRDPGSVAGLGRALEDVEAPVRAAAALALGNSRNREATSFLLGHLDDGDPEVRHAVVSALEDLGDPRAVVPLIGRIQEQRAALRRQAASALGALGDARAIGALIVALGDADAGVRTAAAGALGRLQARDAISALGTLLESESDPEAQAAAIDALGAMQTPTAVDALLRVLGLPRPSREQIQRALARSGESALPSLERSVFQPASTASAEVCVAAIGSIGGENARALIERALRQGAVSATVALAALGEAAQASALPTVLEFLTSDVAAERRAAVDAAGRLLDPSKELGLAVEPIAQALAHAQGSRLERAALLGLLGRTGSARAAASLLPAATSDDEYLRAVALSALGEIGPAGADAALLSALAASSFPIRYTAAMALRRVGDRGSIDPLLDRIGAASLAERETLAVALSGPVHDTPSDAQITRLASLIEQNEGAVKDALIEALAHVPGARGAAALAQLEPALGPPGRAKLAEALAAHAEGREPLLRLLAEDDVAVRANAIWSLGAVGTPADVPALAAVRESADISAAANAVAAVARIAARENVDVSGTLCPALSDERAIVLANALAGLRATHLACPAPDAAAWLLEHHASDEVRLAAARLLRDRWTAVAPGALARCAAKDPSGLVAAECSAPAARDATPQSTIADVGVLVVPTGETSPAAQVPFALVRADGLIRCGTSDRRGAVWETSAPGGPLRLTLPAVFAD